MKKILYFGGQKSGKSRLAELKVLELSGDDTLKPVYIATYDNSYCDSEMAERIDLHRKRRQDKFDTVEEPFNLPAAIHEGRWHIVDCISMWILNNLEKGAEAMLKQLDAVAGTDAGIVFVLNNVSCGIIPADSESRAYVDATGRVGQKLADMCDEVYEVVFGLEKRIK